MTAQEAIDALDNALELGGESITLIRPGRPAPLNTAQVAVACRAIVRGYAPSDLVQGSGIGQQDQKMIISPTALVAVGWPGVGLPAVPQQGDRVRSNRGVLTVQAAAGIYMQDTLVRIELQARGS